MGSRYPKIQLFNFVNNITDPCVIDANQWLPGNIENQRMAVSEVFFKIKLIFFLDTLILKIFFKIIKINNFRVDLSDISAKKLH